MTTLCDNLKDEPIDFAIQADHTGKLKGSENKYKYQDFACKLKTLWNMKVTIILLLIGALGTVTKGLKPGLENLKIRGQVENIKTTGLNTEKSPGDMRRLAVTQTPVGNHQLPLVQKSLKGVEY